MPLPLSFLIVRNPYLDFDHLRFLVASLNQQSNPHFNTFWLDQTSNSEPLQELLQEQAQFDYIIDHDPPTQVAGVPCWDLTRPFNRLLTHPHFGELFVYLHMECLPESNFVESILSLWPYLRAGIGHRFIAMLEQLRSPLQVHELFLADDLFWQQLRLSELNLWLDYSPNYQLPQDRDYYWCRAYSWSENAFLMPTTLALESGLFSAPERPLYFQDVFDIFNYLSQRPYWQEVTVIKLPRSIIYHLQHLRAFEEYSRPFLAQIRQRPDLFADFSIYNFDWQAQHDYQEDSYLRENYSYPPLLHTFYEVFRHAQKGTNHHWLDALDRFHGYQHPTPFQSFWDFSSPDLPPSVGPI